MSESICRACDKYWMITRRNGSHDPDQTGIRPSHFLANALSCNFCKIYALRYLRELGVSQEGLETYLATLQRELSKDEALLLN
jgi:hypothetical protein